MPSLLYLEKESILVDIDFTSNNPIDAMLHILIDELGFRENMIDMDSFDIIRKPDSIRPLRYSSERTTWAVMLNHITMWVECYLTIDSKGVIRCRV